MSGGSMQAEQWCIAVRPPEAEEKRRELRAANILDNRLKPRQEGDFILFPVLTPASGERRALFECHSQADDLPRHDLIGGIAVMQEDDAMGAELLLRSRPSIHTVLFAESAVGGEYRTKEYRILAGEPTTKTRYTEYGMRFDIDLHVAYFSSRLSTERQRILGKMRDGEHVLDMFAGVGPFAITLAPRAATVCAADINPGAIHLMITNILLNKRTNIIPILADAAHLERILPGNYDRIVMNLPLASSRFLHVATTLCREGGTIHFYTLQKERAEYLTLIRSLTGGAVHERLVRSYSPSQHHAVYDIEDHKKV
jgi:tRNA (guanine37-N1)-methyltransferase